MNSLECSVGGIVTQWACVTLFSDEGKMTQWARVTLFSDEGKMTQ